MKKIIFSICLFTTTNVFCMCEEIVSALHDITLGDFFSNPKPQSNKVLLQEINQLKKNERISDSKRNKDIADRYDILLQRARINKSAERMAEYQLLRDEHLQAGQKATLYEEINQLNQEKLAREDYTAKAKKHAHLEILYGKLLEYTQNDDDETTEVKDYLSEATRKRIRAELNSKIETLEIEKNTTELLTAHQELLRTYEENNPKRTGIQIIIERLNKEKNREDQIAQISSTIESSRRSFQPTFQNFDQLVRLHKQRLSLYETDKARYQREYTTDLDTTISLLGRQASLATDQTIKNNLSVQAVQLRLLKSNTQSK